MKRKFRVSLEWLKKTGACGTVYREFERVYGNRSIKISTALRRANKATKFRLKDPEGFLCSRKIITERQWRKAKAIWIREQIKNNADEIARNNYLIRIFTRKGL